MSHPSYTVSTSFGDVVVTVTSGDHVYVEMKDITVHNVTQNGYAHLKLVGGAWEPDPAMKFHAVGLNSRWNGSKHIEPSFAARKAVLYKLVPAVAEWLIAHPEVIAGGERREYQRQVAKLREEIADLEATLKERNSALAALLIHEVRA